MLGHRSPAWIVPPLLLAAALPAVAWSAGGSPAERFAARASDVGLAWHAGSPQAARHSLASLPNCDGIAGASAPQPTARQSSRSSPADPARFRLSAVLGGDGSLTGWDVSATAAGRGLRLALPPESAVRGPVDGWLSVASDDGARSEIHLISPAGACGRLVHSSSDVSRQAVLSPDGTSVLFHAVGRADRLDRGVWRKAIDSADESTAILPPLTAADPILREVGLVWSTELRVAAGGDLLAVESCGAEDCKIRIAGLGAVPRSERRTFPGRVVGLDGRHLVSLRDCEGATCTLIATGLGSGDEVALAGTVTSAATLVIDGRLLVAATSVGQGAANLVVIDPATGSTWREGHGRSSRQVGLPDADDLRLVPPGGTIDAGAELPAGWAAGMVGQAPWLVPVDIAAVVAGPSRETSR